MSMSVGRSSRASHSSSVDTSSNVSETNAERSLDVQDTDPMGLHGVGDTYGRGTTTSTTSSQSHSVDTGGFFSGLSNAMGSIASGVGDFFGRVGSFFSGTPSNAQQDPLASNLANTLGGTATSLTNVCSKLLTADGKSRVGWARSGVNAITDPAVNEHWKVTNRGESLQAKGNAAAAIDAVLDNPEGMKLECKTHSSLVEAARQLADLRDQHGFAQGTNMFNQKHQDLSIGLPGHNSPSLGLNDTNFQTNVEIPVGSRVYFNNNRHVTATGSLAGAWGQNAQRVGTATQDGKIGPDGKPAWKTGDELYMAHPQGLVSRQQIVDSMLSNATHLNYSGQGQLNNAASQNTDFQRDLQSIQSRMGQLEQQRGDVFSTVSEVQDFVKAGGNPEAMRSDWDSVFSRDRALTAKEDAIQNEIKELRSRVEAQQRAATSEPQRSQLDTIIEALDNALPGAHMVPAELRDNAHSTP